MLIALRELQNRLEFLHAEMNKILSEVPPAALDWTPLPAVNSLAVLAAHVAGAERYWIGTVAGNDPLPRNRDAEFETRAVDAAQLIAQLDEVLAHSHSVINHMTPFDLEEVRIAPRDGRRVTVAWTLLHTLSHTATHVGHMEIIRDLWQARR